MRQACNEQTSINTSRGDGNGDADEENEFEYALDKFSHEMFEQQSQIL